MTDTTEPAAARSTRAISVSRLLIGWLAIVALFFIWQTAVYTGLIARFAEWQFAQFGGYFPLASACLLVVLLGIPVLYVLSQRERKAATVYGQGRLLVRFLAVLAVIAGVGALVLLVYAFSLSLATGTPTRIDARSADLIVHDDGAATLSGNVRYDRIAVMDADTPLSAWGVRFVPMMGKSEKGNKLRYFVQTSAGPEAPKLEEVSGTLRRNALRGDIIRLFNDAGYEVATPHYVLYTSNFAMRVSYFWGAFQCLLVALVLGVAAGVQRWRLRRLAQTRRSGTPHAIG